MARGEYGRQDVQRWAGGAPAGPDQSWLPEVDYTTTGAALGFGVLLGIVIGSKLTFHSPIRRR